MAWRGWLQQGVRQRNKAIPNAAGAGALSEARQKNRHRAIVCITRGVRPGEAEVVHRGGGRYVSVIGRNALFHSPGDRGPKVANARAIGAFIDAFATVAKALAGREPYR
jgi:hypothetical protein